MFKVRIDGEVIGVRGPEDDIYWSQAFEEKLQSSKKN